MFLLTRVRTNSHLKRLAGGVEKRLKKSLLASMQRFIQAPAPETIDSLEDINSILIIRPNFRLGNALISTPVIDALRERFPSARIDYLATDKTLPLLQHRPVDHFYCLSRKAILRPWLCVALLRCLRAKRYDLAVQVSAGSTTGFIATRFIRARYSMGASKGKQRWYSIEAEGNAAHTYDAVVNLARPLGVNCRNRPLLQLTPLERHQAVTHLSELLMTKAGSHGDEGFVALFVGGHQNKRWPLTFWLGLLDALEPLERRYIVFLGPEEFRFSQALQQRLSTSKNGTLCHPRPIREFAAMLARADVLVTPDSGPMHLAAALDVPTISLVRVQGSLAFIPREPYDIMLWQPDISMVLSAIQSISSVMTSIPDLTECQSS
jgi:heptosyltransferase-3